jgi:hypothetical protein
MSIRFDASNDHPSYTATSPPSPVAGITVAGWVYINVDRNDWSTICRFHSSSGGSTNEVIGFDGSGNTPQVFSASGSVVGAACTIAKWYYLGFTQTGTAAKFYQGDETTAATEQVGTVTPGTAPTGFTFGGRSTGDLDEWLNGRMTKWRIWNTVLTLAELNAERTATAPVKSTGLWANYPMATATDLADTVAGRNLVANTGTLTTEGDPTLPTVGGAKIWNGSSWVVSSSKNYNGSTWVDTGTIQAL